MSQLDQVDNMAMDHVSQSAGVSNGDVGDIGQQDMTDGANNLIAMAGTLVPVDRQGNEVSNVSISFTPNMVVSSTEIDVILHVLVTVS